MIPLSEARAYVLERMKALPPTKVKLDSALGLVLAQPVASTDAIPPFDNTAVDGFALRSMDTTTAPVTLDVVATIAAGDDPKIELGPKEAARIMTGAPLPLGADAVIMVEQTRLVRQPQHTRPTDDSNPSGSSDPNPSGSSEFMGERVIIKDQVRSGDHVRLEGDDVSAGETVLSAGISLTPAHLGVLSSIGAYEVTAHSRPRVGVVSTGDELVDEPGPLRRGKIRDSNRYSLLGLLSDSGFTGVDLGIVRDDEHEIEKSFSRAIKECDAILSSGGVSMGEHDYVKVVLDRLGEMRWMQIAIKPAKPFAFGLLQGTPVFGLPGNPVSSMVGFELLAKPALRAMAGHGINALGPFSVQAVCQNTLSCPNDGKTHYVRVSTKRDQRGILQVAQAGGQGSHQLTVMAQADGLAVIPDGTTIQPGDSVSVILL